MYFGFYYHVRPGHYAKSVSLEGKKEQGYVNPSHNTEFHRANNVTSAVTNVVVSSYTVFILPLIK